MKIFACTGTVALRNTNCWQWKTSLCCCSGHKWATNQEAWRCWEESGSTPRFSSEVCNKSACWSLWGALSLSFFLGGGGGCYQTYKLGFDVTKLLHLFAILSSSCRLEDKVSNLESENQVLRQQALAISPTAKALTARPKTTIIQVKNACPTFHLDEHLHIDGNVLLIVESWMQRTPENGNVQDGDAKKAAVWIYVVASGSC